MTIPSRVPGGPLVDADSGRLDPALVKFLDDLRTTLLTDAALLSSTAFENYAFNGGMMVAQRATAPLSTVLQYGSVDRMKVAVTVGTVSAGTIQQATAAPLGRTGFALQVAGASMTTTPTLSVDTYIESKHAIALKNAIVSLAVNVYHDTGSNQSYTLLIDKATVADNFAATTNIATSTPLPVVNASSKLLTLINVNMGDCSNGIRIRINVSPGTVVTKNFYYTELVLSEGGPQSGFPYQSFADELQRCQRYFRKSFAYATSPAQNVGIVGVVAYYVQNAGALFNGATIPIMMRTTPTMTYFNPSAANASWRNTNRVADSGAAATGNIGDSIIQIANPQVAADATNQVCTVHYTANADF